MSNSVKVDIWSDVQCPWCFIGKRRFDAAVAQLQGQITVEVEYHSFELNPDAPVESDCDAFEFLTRKGMSPTQIPQIWDRLRSLGADLDIAMAPELMVPTNSVLAHQALHLAKRDGKQAELNDRLLRAVFVEGRHVGRIDELVELAEEVGLDAATVRASLEANEFFDAVRDDEARATNLQIHGVPFFVFDSRYGISGAQDVSTFVEVLHKVMAERVAEQAAEG